MILVLIVVISFATRFLFFGHPSSVIFDEVHIGNYVTNYWQGTYFFDVHPPLAKLLIAAFGWLIGANNETANWTAIGNLLPTPFLFLRLLPIVLGTALPIIIYWICRRLNYSKFISLLAALLIVFENSVIVLSRTLMPDTFILFFGFLSLGLYLEYKQNVRFKKSFFVATVVAASLVASIKWTGLSFMLLIFILEAYDFVLTNGRFFKKVFKHIVKFAFIFLGSYALIYGIVFAVHFKLLPKSGDGNAYMSASFQKDLIGNDYAKDPSIEKLSFIQKFVELNETMFTASAGLKKEHDYSSKWYTWPLLVRPIFAWQDRIAADTGENKYIYLLSNPLLHWIGTFSILLTLIIWGKRYFTRISISNRLLFVSAGFLVNYLPFIFIGRVMFIYHYIPALIFSILAIAYLLDNMPQRKKVIVALCFFALVLTSFLFWSPITYGTPISEEALNARMWLPSWR